MDGRVNAGSWTAPIAEGATFTKLLTVYSAAGVIALVAWVLNVGQLYWMAGALALLPQASRLVAALEQQGLSVTRTLPGSGHQGEEVTVRITVENRWLLPKLHLSVRDVLPRGLTALPAEPLPLHLPPRGRDSVEYALRLGRRGWHQLSSVHFIGTDPLGLAHRECRLTLPERVLVFPRVVPLPEQVLPPEVGGGSAPVEGTRRQGEGTSFFGIREYRPGDPLRHVHWRTAARAGKLTVVEWEAEESRDIVIALETAQSAQRDWRNGSTLDAAAGLAASLASLFQMREHSVRLIAPGATGWEPEGRRGGAAMMRTLEELARMEPGPKELAAEFRRLAPLVAPGATVCWLTPKVDELLVEECRYLQAARLRPVVYGLVDSTGANEGALHGLRLLGVPAILVRRDDELTRTLLN